MSAGQAEPGTVTSRPAAPEDTAVVRVEKLVKCFGSNRVLDGIDLDIAKGEVVSLMGQSGGGKTTLLRCINFTSGDSSAGAVPGAAPAGSVPASRHRWWVRGPSVRPCTRWPGP